MAEDGLIRVIGGKLIVDVGEHQLLFGQCARDCIRVQSAQIRDDRRLRYDHVDADAERTGSPGRRRLVDDLAVAVWRGAPLHLTEPHQLLCQEGSGIFKRQADELWHF